MGILFFYVLIMTYIIVMIANFKFRYDNFGYSKITVFYIVFFVIIDMFLLENLVNAISGIDDGLRLSNIIAKMVISSEGFWSIRLYKEVFSTGLYITAAIIGILPVIYFFEKSKKESK